MGELSKNGVRILIVVFLNVVDFHTDRFPFLLNGYTLHSTNSIYKVFHEILETFQWKFHSRTTLKNVTLEKNLVLNPLF